MEHSQTYYDIAWNIAMTNKKLNLTLSRPYRQHTWHLLWGLWIELSMLWFAIIAVENYICRIYLNFIAFNLFGITEIPTD